MLDESAPALAVTLAITPLPARNIASLTWPKSEPHALTPPGKRSNNIIWNGPNAWLVLDEDPVALAARTGGIVTDQSDGLSLFAVSGPHAREILKRLIAIDLRESAFAEDAAAITSAAHIGVRLWRQDQSFILACFRSFAAALHHALVAAEISVTRG